MKKSEIKKCPKCKTKLLVSRFKGVHDSEGILTELQFIGIKKISTKRIKEAEPFSCAVCKPVKKPAKKSKKK